MNILAEIIDFKYKEVAAAKQQLSLEAVRQKASQRSDIRDFSGALRRKDGKVALIAEVKKASPSAGLIRADFHPVGIAQEYQQGGASALSVLTDQKYFQGDLAYLQQIRDRVSLPLLRKDFTVDEYQIWEARAFGADAILLIVAALSEQQLRNLYSKTVEAGLHALVEVHDEAELEVALRLEARNIGINNRDLKKFVTNLETTEKLCRKISSDRTIISESGIQTSADVDRLKRSGIHAILVGESLMRQQDLVVATRKLLS